MNWRRIVDQSLKAEGKQVTLENLAEVFIGAATALEDAEATYTDQELLEHLMVKAMEGRKWTHTEADFAAMFLRHTAGNYVAAAKRMGIGKSSMYRLIPPKAQEVKP